MASIADKLIRRIRWFLGKGYDQAHFESFYAGKGADSWGYGNSPVARRRFERLLGMLPERGESASVLEVGCAEGHFTRILAERVQDVVACDISADAVGRALQTCAAYPNVRIAQGDVRDGLPDGAFDLVVYADVLYYLSKKEAGAVLAETARRLAPGSFLMFSNEWKANYQYLLAPKEILKIIADSGNWAPLRSEEWSEDGITLAAALFRRV